MSKQLGNWYEIADTVLDVYATYTQTQNQSKAHTAALQQLEAERLMQIQRMENEQRMLRIAVFGGGILLATGIMIYALKQS